MRICAVADLHGYLPEIEPCHLLLIAGDICPVTDHSTQTQSRFLADDFRCWLDHVPCPQVMGIAGNHDFIFQDAPEFVHPGLRWKYLQDSGHDLRTAIEFASVAMHPKKITIQQPVTIWGSPWQPVFHDWAFNLPEQDLRERWERIPDKVDILLLHGPPAGFGDRTADGRDVGSPSLRKRIEQIKPRLTVFGHNHEGYGRWEQPWGTLANVSLRDQEYRVVNEPMYFDLEL